MTKFLQLIIFSILLFNVLLFPQWSTDPNNTLIVGYGQDPHICNDSAGGCYITYNYETTFYPQKLAVERLDKYGYKPWGALKQIQGELPEQWQAEIIEDGEGGVIISYEDNEWIQPYDITTRVRVQKVDSLGNLLWGQTGVRVSLSEINQGAQELVSNGEGGCILVWQNNDGSYWINHINLSGQREWGDSGIAVGNGDSKWIIRASDGNYYVQTGQIVRRIRKDGQILKQYSVTLGYIIPDNEGGIVLSGRVWTGMIPNLVAQRKDSLGNNLWQEPYVEIADSLYINSPININQIHGNYYYNWYGTKNGVELVVQYQAVRPDGSFLFSEGSQLISDYPVDALIGGMLPSDSGTVVMVWQDYRPDDGVFGQRLDTSGNKLWDTNDVPLFTGTCADLYSTTDGKGGAIVLGWHQYNFSMRAFKVSKYGNLGEVIIPVELISFNAEVVNNKIKLNWITATEKNNRGFAVERFAESLNKKWEKIGFVPGAGTTTEPKSYSFIDENVMTGNYKYRLKQIDFDGKINYSKVIKVDVNFTPGKFVLFQNYPNPFNPITNIEYRIPNKEFITLMVYDVLGNEVAALVNEEKPAGRYSVIFDAKNIPSGVYFYGLKAGNFFSIKKMVLVK